MPEFRRVERVSNSAANRRVIVQDLRALRGSVDQLADTALRFRLDLLAVISQHAVDQAGRKSIHVPRQKRVFHPSQHAPVSPGEIVLRAPRKLGPFQAAVLRVVGRFALRALASIVDLIRGDKKVALSENLYDTPFLSGFRDFGPSALSGACWHRM
jgi:hypothetical protein